MSGTSADGIDTALVELSGDPLHPGWRVVAYRTDPFESDLREAILLAVKPESALLSEGARLHVRLGEEYGRSLLELMDQAGHDPDELDGVGLHGQTVFHDPVLPHGVSYQIGSAAVVAEMLECDVIYDFRSRDVAVGGEGAPLVPYADAVLLRDPGRDRIAQNMGGIANLTWLPAGTGLEGVSGFDTGPGNLVVDGIIRLVTGGDRMYDRNGALARSGEVVEELLQEWLSHPFLRHSPPRSAGREDFGDAFVLEALAKWGEKHSLEDLLRTAVEFTVESIARSYEDFLPERRGKKGEREVVISGGGARNPLLVELLAERISPDRLMMSDTFGIPVDSKEAVAFALLADAFLAGVSANIPDVTGARKRVVLGSLVPGSARRFMRSSKADQA